MIVMCLILMWSFRHTILLVICSVIHLSYNDAKEQKIQQKENNNHIYSLKEFTLASDAILAKDRNKISSVSAFNVQNSVHNLGDKNHSYPCLLGTGNNYTSWWQNSDGSLTSVPMRGRISMYLDLSYNSSDPRKLYEVTYNIVKGREPSHIVAFSVAGNNLTRAPMEALMLINNTIQYLTLRKNIFATPLYSGKRSEHGPKPYWWTFPEMRNVKELDISHCGIDYLEKDAFEQFPNLEYLYLGYNRFPCLPGNLFLGTPHLKHIDVSNVQPPTSISTNSLDPALEPYLRVIDGLTIPEGTFKSLTNLRHLDISFTKIYPTSAWAFSYLSKSMEYLSLCFTSIPVLPKGIFANTSIRILDLSGNPSISDLTDESFEGIEHTLEILALEMSNIQVLDWLRNLKSLRVLKLASNNIKILTNETFTNLTNLRILDLKSNHIGNWYYRVFTANKQLMILNLRDNNINMVTSEMYRDFANLIYLALGQNNFVCGCILRDLIEIAAKNSDNTNCTEYIKDQLYKEQRSLNIPVHSRSIRDTTRKIKKYDVITELMKDITPLVAQSQINMQKTRARLQPYYRIYDIRRSQSGTYYRSKIEQRQETSCGRRNSDWNTTSYDGYLTLSDGEPLSFSFRLLDYEESDYWCFNSSNNSHQHQFADLSRCGARSIIDDVEEAKDYSIEIIAFVITIFIIITLMTFIYFKWWYIRYFFITVKNSLILSFMDKKKNKDPETSNRDPEYTYDIFVSYCDENRDWVLEELLPSLEKSNEITICLHERDFQVGMSILENIISCMDRSRCLMLIISNSFLQSQWCQFEMHLAQHRLFETRKENLVLVLLEDIPKQRRPKTLHYLMKVKTYIKWPLQSSDLSFGKTLFEERNLFWKRLRKSLSEHCENYEETLA